MATADDTKEPCTACKGTGCLLVKYRWTEYRPDPKRPCRVCKGRGHILPPEIPPVQIPLV